MAAGPGLGDFSHAEHERLVVREYREGLPLKAEPEVSHSEVHGQELAVEGAVLGLWFAQLLAGEPQRLPGTFDLLLEDSAYSNVRGVLVNQQYRRRLPKVLIKDPLVFEEMPADFPGEALKQEVFEEQARSWLPRRASILSMRTDGLSSTRLGQLLHGQSHMA